jgi:acyl-coenzyme A thioesterase 13
VTAAEPGKVDFELDIRKEHTVNHIPPRLYKCSFTQNRLNIMHGGTIASMGNETNL